MLPAMTGSFSEATALRHVDEDLYEGTIDPAWWVVRGPHGGYLSSLILRALMSSLDDQDRHIRSFTTHFVAAPEEGSIRIATTLDRSGKSMTAMSARVFQGDRLVARSLAAFSLPWDDFTFDDAQMPECPSPEESFPVPVDGEDMPPFLGNFDMRWCLGSPPFSGADEALVGGWYRLRPPETADSIVVATLMDAWAPAVFPVATEPVVAPTIDLTIHFRTQLPLEGAGPDDFYLGRFSSKLASEGFFEEDGELWSAGGRLLAQSRQLALTIMPR
jgi:acyl-CoA thioesterase